MSDLFKKLSLLVRLYLLNLRISKMAIELDNLNTAAAALTVSVDSMLAREAAAPASIDPAALVSVTDAINAAVAKIDAVK